MRNTSNTLSNTHSPIDLNHCESKLWKLSPHKIMGHILILPNKRVSGRECWKVSVASILQPNIYYFAFMIMENAQIVLDKTLNHFFRSFTYTFLS